MFWSLARLNNNSSVVHKIEGGVYMRSAVNKNKQLGQGMTEYIIIVALIAVAAIAVTQLFGTTIRNQMAAISQEVAGGDGTDARQKAGDAAQKAQDDAAKTKTLADYTNQKDKALK
jgi:Flp pilus assembly pilin Flp